jgi:hypothetical protein
MAKAIYLAKENPKAKKPKSPAAITVSGKAT